MLRIVLLIIILLGVYGVFAYNSLVRLRNRCENAWGHVSVQLQRRHELIPNLVETVKGYANHERDTLEAVIDARNQAVAADTVESQGAAENMLSGALRSLFALAENYPDLRASEQFGQLQTQLTETENKVAIARQIYNDTVLSYNNKVETVPSNLVASLTSQTTLPTLHFGPENTEAPDVSF